MNRPLTERTTAICNSWKRRRAAGEGEREIAGALASEYGVQRPAIWKALRTGGVIAPYGADPARSKGGRPKGGGRPGYTTGRLERSATAEQRRADEERPPEDIRLAPAEPCPRCNVRADVGCRHRAAEGPLPIAVEDTALPPDRRRDRKPGFGPGTAFHMREMSDRAREIR